MIMKYKYNILTLIFCALLLSSCTEREGSVGTVIPNDQKIEDTIPGWFIKALELDYSSGKIVTILIHERLSKFGALIDKFKDEKGYFHLIWEYHYDRNRIMDIFRKKHQVLNPMIWYSNCKRDKLIIEEKITPDGFTFIFRYPPPGVPWTELLAKGDKGLATDRENMVVIKTKSDKYTRIFLYGKGSYCKEVEVF